MNKSKQVCLFFIIYNLIIICSSSIFNIAIAKSYNSYETLKANDDFVFFEINENNDIHVLNNDVFEGMVNVNIVTMPKKGMAEILEDKLEYTAPNYATTDSLQYVICDFDEVCDSAWVHIIVVNGDNPPEFMVIANDDYVVIEPFMTAINPVNNDFIFPDPFFATVTIIEYPTHGNAQVLGKQNIAYTNIGEPQSDFLMYEVCIITPDDEMICDMATIYFVADSMPPPPPCDNCVWAGDANNDGMVNMFDLLPIGLTFGEQGDQRLNASIEWVAQPASNWNTEFEFEDPQTLENKSLNTKYADCDGNGQISAEDTLAINQNFGYVHNKTNLNSDLSPVSVYCVFGNDTLQEGQWVQADIFVATDNTPAEDLYGTVFSIEYPTNIIDLQTIKLNLTNNGWLTADDPNALLMYRNNMAGQVDIGFTRTNKQTVSGYGKMATIGFKIIDNIDGKQQDIALNLKVKNSFGSNNKGKLMQFTPKNTQAMVFTKTAIQNIDNKQNINIQTYPNPANTALQVVTNEPFEYLELKNVFGQTVFKTTNTLNSSNATLNVAQLPAGIYILSIEQKGVVYTKKVMLSR